MKTADADILIVPGWSSSGPDHWQSRWERNLKTARRVEQADWYHPSVGPWTGRLLEAAATASRPVIVVAHSLGVATLVHAAQRAPRGLIAGAFLVAPADVENAALWPVTAGYTFDDTHGGFAPLPMGALPFPSALISSQNDPYCSAGRAAALAAAWGAELMDSGESGHINVDSGHGPWPEGLLKFGQFLQRIK